jgi:hypothetical protein
MVTLHELESMLEPARTLAQAGTIMIHEIVVTFVRPLSMVM